MIPDQGTQADAAVFDMDRKPGFEVFIVEGDDCFVGCFPDDGHKAVTSAAPDGRL